jgi:drug/metabolite transporter (DMT)-like permease
LGGRRALMGQTFADASCGRARRKGVKVPRTKMRTALSVKPALRLPAIDITPRIEHGMILTAAGAFIAPTGHAIAKLLDGVSAGESAWARFFYQLVFLLPFFWASYGGSLSAPSLSQAVRGALVAATTLCFFWALRTMPLANCAAIFYVEPLILTAISALFLGEPIGWRRISAVAIGFLGVLIVIRPSFDDVGAAALLPLLCAVFFASYMAITRHRTAAETALAAQFWICLFSMIVLTGAIAAGGRLYPEVLGATVPTLREAGLLALMGVIGLFSQRLLIQALRVAPASILAPLQYTEIVGAIVVGAIMFGDLPDPITSLGMVIVVGAGLYVFRRERMLARQPARG